MRYRFARRVLVLVVVLGALVVALSSCSSAQSDSRNGDQTIFHVSYDLGRDVFRNMNEAFVQFYREQTGHQVRLVQSHAGSSSQARSVLDGLPADVVSMNQFLDMQLLREASLGQPGGPLLQADWSAKYPNNSSPFRTTLAFAVREGNPKNIRDWDDLAGSDVRIVASNFKSTGSGRYAYLNAWAFGLKHGNSSEAASALVASIMENILVMAAGGRAATNAFVGGGLGDVLISFESEVALMERDLGIENFDIVVPSYGIAADIYVAVVDRNSIDRGTRAIGEAYWEFVYSTRGQEIAAESYYRPFDPIVADRYAELLPEIELFSVEEIFGSWENAARLHFADGGSYDRIAEEGRR